MNEYVVLLRYIKGDEVRKVVIHVYAKNSFVALIGCIKEFHSKHPDHMIINVQMFEV